MITTRHPVETTKCTIIYYTILGYRMELFSF